MIQPVDVSNSLVSVGTMSAWAHHSNAAPWGNKFMQLVAGLVMEEEWFLLLTFYFAFPSEPHTATLCELTECLTHPNRITVIEQETFFSLNEVMQWAHDMGFCDLITITRKHWPDNDRIIFESVGHHTFRIHKDRYLNNHLVLCPNRQNIRVQKSIYKSVNIISSDPLWKFGVCFPSLYALCI